MRRSTHASIICWFTVLATVGGCSSESPPEGPTQQQTVCLDVLEALGMPFEYQGDASGFEVRTADDSWAPLVFGPWGAHNSPHTGHIGGNAKADMMAVLANGGEEMTALDGSPCIDYEPGAPTCGQPQAELLARRPQYRLPDGFSAELLAAMEEHEIAYRVREVMVSAKGELGSEEWLYWDSPDNWEVAVEICGYSFAFGHTGAIGPALRTALTERGVAVNFDDFGGTVGVNLVAGLDPAIELAPGTIVSYPQLVGRPVPAGNGQPVAYAVPHDNTSVLWAQVEFFTIRYDVLAGEGYFTPVYALLDPSERAVWEAALATEMDDPSSARYGNPLAQERQWLWRAEGHLIHSPEFPVDAVEKFPLRRLGDWFETYERCGVQDVKCDEVIVFNRIDRDADGFDPSFYGAKSQHLVWWARTGTTPFDGYYGEVLSASGDLEADASGTFVVRWRNFNGGAPVDATPHQGLAYHIGDDDVMRLRWGARVAEAVDVVLPAIPGEQDVCDGTTITCHTAYDAQTVRRENIDAQL